MGFHFHETRIGNLQHSSSKTSFLFLRNNNFIYCFGSCPLCIVAESSQIPLFKSKVLMFAEPVIMKYSAANLMWSFDGPIHQLNTKYEEMVLRKETYDSSLTGAALQVTRDGLYNASLGNYRYRVDNVQKLLS